MKLRFLILSVIVLVAFSFNCAFAETVDDAEQMTEGLSEIDNLSYDELIELRNHINDKIIEIAREKYESDTLTQTDGTVGTLAELFEDEAIAMYVRDELGKFSIEQPVTQDELDTVLRIQITRDIDYGTITSLKGISCLRNLQTLGLYNGCAKSLQELPDELFTITTLTRLEVPSTSLSKIPDEIGNLTALNSLDVSYSDISSLPSTVANLSSLKDLDIAHTQITEFPEALYTLSLEKIDMAGLPIK